MCVCGGHEPLAHWYTGNYFDFLTNFPFKIKTILENSAKKFDSSHWTCWCNKPRVKEVIPHFLNIESVDKIKQKTLERDNSVSTASHRSQAP